MSTLLVNKIKSVTGDTVTISGSNIIVQGKTTLGDQSGTDTVRVFDDMNLSGSLNLSGSFKFTPNISQLPTADPGVSGQVFITGSTGMNLGGITGSGTFKILCVSAG